MSTGLENLRILLVEDNKNMRTIVQAVLKSMGVTQIRQTRDGSEALEALRDFPADIAMVDFQMFPMDGVDFTRLVRQSPDSKNPYLAIIMMTGHAEEARVHEARDAGVTEFLVKPITAGAVISRVNAVIYRPRAFVKTEDYFGPDRRRRADPYHTGPWRREGDSKRDADDPGALVDMAREGG